MIRFFIIAVFAIVLNSEATFSQNDCFSMQSYPFLDLSTIHDSTDYAKDMDWLFRAQDLYYESMFNCKMPAINVITVDGDSITNKKLLGNVVLINFWFKECAPCVEEIPFLDSIQQHFKNKNVVFIGISRNSKEEIVSFVKEKKFTYIMIAGRNELSGKFAQNGWPQTYIFDKKNRFKAIYRSIIGNEKQLIIENKILELL
jgi:thiol-disulfide isomerase/thioredoxin